MLCPACGKNNVKKNGFKKQKTGKKVQKYLCKSKNCNKNFLETINKKYFNTKLPKETIDAIYSKYDGTLENIKALSKTYNVSISTVKSIGIKITTAKTIKKYLNKFTCYKCSTNAELGYSTVSERAGKFNYLVKRISKKIKIPNLMNIWKNYKNYIEKEKNPIKRKEAIDKIIKEYNLSKSKYEKAIISYKILKNYTEFDFFINKKTIKNKIYKEYSNKDYSNKNFYNKIQHNDTDF